MTPEDRASRVVFLCGDCYDGSPCKCTTRLADAIRAAENDALELAACEADRANDNEDMEMPGGAAGAAARCIRALKHK